MKARRKQYTMSHVNTINIQDFDLTQGDARLTFTGHRSRIAIVLDEGQMRRLAELVYVAWKTTDRGARSWQRRANAIGEALGHKPEPRDGA